MKISPNFPVRERAGRHLSGGARWLFGVILVLAPWLYGSTEQWAMDILLKLFAFLFCTVFLYLAVQWRLPRVPLAAAVLSLALFVFGWGEALNAIMVDRATFLFYKPFPALPGAMNRGLAISCMGLLTGMLCAFWVTCDLAANPVWRNRIWSIISCAGLSIMLLGLLQRVSGARNIFWAPVAEQGIFGGTFFATYLYHGHAGAFINLVLPFIICRAVYSFRTDENQIFKAFWSIAVLAVIASAFVNVSRGAMLVSVLTLAVFGLWFVWSLASVAVRKGRGASLFIALAVVAGMVLLVIAVGGASGSFDRWQYMGLDSSGRNHVWAAIWQRAIPVSGLWGLGPGSFVVTFPGFAQFSGGPVPGGGTWVFAHEDYLQTIMEWGWFGAALWAGLFFGGLGYGIWKLAGVSRKSGRDSSLLLTASVISLGGVLIHSVVDYPLQIASLQLYAAVALGFVWALCRPVGR